ncbi:hypothetical protein [Cryobacterium sp. PAMC25264]|uniref:hypothetical protein n=1 Tax=Cryobacterium sp. PAMC25264 TaxID=2861288 RepID=UPI001C62FE94|nr:hypothetical protein [Cryobacterium sp. PAMC25264]QYF73261.1 hypothetical protein KY500_16245 [Cryobacterium sp. PAMC25264]
MNGTNRLLNRALVLVIGLLAVALGAAAVALVAVPDFMRAWARTAPDVTAGLTELLAGTAVGDTGASWVPFAALLIAVLVTAGLVLFIARQGRGHTERLIEADPTADGATIVDAAVAEEMLTAALHDRPEFRAVTVSTYPVHGSPVLKISATVRRGVSPRDAITVIETAVHGLDTVLGAEVPVLVRLGGGLQSRLTGRARLRPTGTARPAPGPQTHPTTHNHPLEKERTP